MSSTSSVSAASGFFRSLFVDYFVDEANWRLMFRLLKLSRIDVESEHVHPEHVHYYYELIVPCRGNYRCRLNEAPLTVGSGSALLVQPGDRHSDIYPDGSGLMFMQFHLKDIRGLPWTDGIFTPNQPCTSRILDISVDSEIDTLIPMLTRHNQEGASRLVALSKLCEAFLWDFIALIPPDSLSSGFAEILKINQFAELTKTYFNRHIFGKLDMADFCRNVGMCRRAAEKKFTEVFRTSPHQMFTGLKIKLAEEMLRSGSSMKETADRLGFGDQFYFSTVFKRVTGFPPSKLIGN